MVIMVELKVVSWSDVMTYLLRIVEGMGSDGFRPDVVVGIMRGGVIAARLIGDLLGVDSISLMEIKFYKGIGEQGDEPRITQPLTINVKGKRVLVIDDIADSGNTMRTAIDYIKGMNPLQVKTATLLLKPWTKFKPDYYGGETTMWIVFPWELGETIRELGSNSMQLVSKMDSELAGKIMTIMKILNGNQAN
ncbi:phosphoribosyltransferase [Thermocladium modestius]|uniref:Phosphoribosyltransferase n=2 Tax=Thermocladium modestius TaxID=62609 RepID=A0A830GRA1_9CREN|nr:phosphoribosyltransferase [Thermocladium modestius]